MEIWYNPSCSKCRIAGQELAAAGLDVPQRRYLEEPPTADELAVVLDKLGMQPWELVRMGEPIAKELGLRSWPKEAPERARWIAAMVENPKLIERPIVLLDNGHAMVARSPEALRDIIAAAD